MCPSRDPCYEPSFKALLGFDHTTPQHLIPPGPVPGRGRGEAEAVRADGRDLRAERRVPRPPAVRGHRGPRRAPRARLRRAARRTQDRLRLHGQGKGQN